MFRRSLGMLLWPLVFIARLILGPILGDRSRIYKTFHPGRRVTRRQWVTAVIAVVLVYGLFFALRFSPWPWLAESPLITIARSSTPADGPSRPWAFFAVAVIVALLIVSIGRKQRNHEYNAMEIAVVREECLFRLDAERWNMVQRVRSCAAFGLLHVLLLVFPYAVIVTHALLGGLFMAEYLRAFRRTRSKRPSVKQKAAIRASAALHYAFNYAALVCLLVLSVLQIVLRFFL